MNLPRVLRILGTGLLVIVLVAALTGCGSDDESESSKGTTTTGASSPLDGWAQGFCTSVAAWQGSVKTTAAKLSESQADFASASEAIKSANEILIDSLKGLGSPPAPASTQAKDAIDALSGDLQDGAAAVNEALTGNFTTQSEIAQASADARASLSTMKRHISATVTKLKALPDEEGWKQAFQDSAACKVVVNG